MADERMILPGWTTGKCIGQGSYGKVYEIYREAYGVQECAALKVLSIPQDPGLVDTLRASGMDDESITAQFDRQAADIVREYQIMEGLRNCPYIVHCEDLKVEKSEPGFSILMRLELLSPLIQALEQGHAKTEKSILTLASNLCTALETCRQQNILHRDVKPQNIFLAPDGSFKLGDFGIARTGEGQATMGVGTYAFMAPEVLSGQDYDSRADIYSLGLVLYWLLNSYRGPFLPKAPQSVTAQDQEKAHARRFGGEPLPKPSQGSDALQAIILKACAFDPRQRYATAGEMQQDLNALIAGKGTISALKTETPAKKKWLLPLCAGAAALAVAVGGFALFSGKSEAPAETVPVTEAAIEEMTLTFQDPVIEQIMLKQTGKASGQITLADCETVKVVSLVYEEDDTLTATTLADFQYFPNLASLTIENCQDLTGLSGLAGCTKLETLSLTNVPAKDLNFLSQLSALTELTLNQCGTEDYSALANLKNLTQLHLVDSCLVPGLGYLDATYFYLPEEMRQGIMSGAVDLEEGIRYTSPSGAGITMSVWDDRADNPGIAEILGEERILDAILVQLPQLKTLSVDSAQIQDPSVLQQAANLRKLTLNGYENLSSDALSQLTQLTTLTIQPNLYRDLEADSYEFYQNYISDRDVHSLDAEALIESLKTALPSCTVSLIA